MSKSKLPMRLLLTLDKGKAELHFENMTEKEIVKFFIEATQQVLEKGKMNGRPK